MTLEDAQRVANIIRFADGGCSSCVQDLIERANKVWPEFVFKQGPAIEIEDGLEINDTVKIMHIPSVTVELK